MTLTYLGKDAVVVCHRLGVVLECDALHCDIHTFSVTRHLQAMSIWLLGVADDHNAAGLQTMTQTAALAQPQGLSELGRAALYCSVTRWNCQAEVSFCFVREFE